MTQTQTRPLDWYVDHYHEIVFRPTPLLLEWIAALRSGKYSQGVSFLRRRIGNNVAFCCLGVLCDVVDPNGWQPAHNPNKGNGWVDPEAEVRGGGHTVLVPDRLLPQWFQDRLTEMNDDRGDDFNEIANYIEGKIEGR